VTDPKDQVKNYSYSLDDNLQGVSYTNEEHDTPNVSFTHENAFNRMATMSDGTGTTTYTYHSIGATPPLGASRLSSVDGPLSNDSISYNYDELGRMASRVINGVALTYDYDAIGRISAVVNALGTFTYEYEGVTSRLRRVNYPNGQTSTYAYYPNSGDHRLQEIHHKKSDGTTLSKFNYTYDVVENIKTWTQQPDANPAKAYDFEYDRADQLRTAVWRTNDASPTILKRYAYTYDPAGNRTVEQIDNAPVLSAYDNMNRLASQTPGGTMRFAGALNEAATVTIQSLPATVTSDNRFERGTQVSSGTNQVVVKAKDYAGNERTNTYEVSVSGSTKTFTFDDNGNMVGDGARTFEWDAENRLIAVKEGSTTLASFTYNGDGRRATKTAGGVTTSNVYDGPHIVEERPSAGGTVRYFFGMGTDDVLAKQDSAGASYYVKDHLGSVRQVTNALGSVVVLRDYDPWGNLLSGTSEPAFAFTGREWDPESQLYYYRARYYHPSVARFISEDPIGIRGGPNFYRYVLNSPAMFNDPFGLVVQICNRPAEGMPGNHSYLHDPATGRNCGQGSNSGRENPGRSDTTCIDVSGSGGRENLIFACCEAQRNSPLASNWWMWRPFGNDCHNVVKDSLKCAGISNPPGAPGGHFGPTTKPPDPPDPDFHMCSGGICLFTGPRTQ
jgi:RHS repeat-associated protein